jgi:glutamine synthetase
MNVAHGYQNSDFMQAAGYDNGSGMAISRFEGRQEYFYRNRHGGLSQQPLYYIGGIFKHAHY